MTNQINSEKIFQNLILIVIIIYGFYLCLIGGYGSDEDTLPMIYVFESRLIDGTFVTSRFTGNPVAEIGIGFLSHFLEASSKFGYFPSFLIKPCLYLLFKF